MLPNIAALSLSTLSSDSNTGMKHGEKPPNGKPAITVDGKKGAVNRYLRQWALKTRTKDGPWKDGRLLKYPPESGKRPEWYQTTNEKGEIVDLNKIEKDGLKKQAEAEMQVEGTSTEATPKQVSHALLRFFFNLLSFGSWIRGRNISTLSPSLSLYL